MTLALTAGGAEMSLMNDMAKHVRDVLYTVDGVKKINILGVQEERIYMEMSTIKLAQLGINPVQLADILSTQNIIQPGATVDTGHSSFVF